MGIQDGSRYKANATSKYFYMNEFLVECPKCGKDALVTVPKPFFNRGGKLTCFHCSHVELARDRIRYNIIIARYCDNCGKHFEYKVPHSKQKSGQITVACPYCGQTRSYVPKNEEIMLTYDNSMFACDPIFNLPLWFQTNVRGHILWAYNRRHLMDIKEYVISELRERQTLQFTTMVERLPQFIKEAKNRSSIIKGIEKMEKRSS